MNYSLLFPLLLPFVLLVNAQYAPEPRWGQASLLLGNSLFIHGGKTDTSNGQTYSSAPTNSDVLYLDLSEPFTTSSVPWNLVNSESLNNESWVLGPSVAWHSLNAFNASHALAFGGVPDVNSQPPVWRRSDSAAVMDAFHRTSPSFDIKEEGWGGQPQRRIHHTGVSTPDGKVYIIGGEVPDNQDDAYSENYVFDYAEGGSTFSPLPGGLPDITGHCSVVLPNKYVLVLGGYSPSSGSMVDFESIYVLDTTQSTPSWSTFATTGAVPRGRRGFACTLFQNNKVYIHGGSDAHRLNVYSDGWVLDLSPDTWSWSPVPALSDLGARSDHFAISSGKEIIFGFGYGSSSPADAIPLIFLPTIIHGSGSGSDTSDDSGGTWTDAHTPPSPGEGEGDDPLYTQTVPPHGTATQPPYTGIGGSSGVPKPSSTSQVPTNDPEPDNSSKAKTTRIAIGASIGLLALVVVVAIVTYRVRQRREVRRQFLALSSGDDDNMPPGAIIPVARSSSEKRFSHTLLRDDPTQGGLGRDIIAALGVPALASAINHVVTKSAVVQPARRDMLADEDVRDFGIGAWYDQRRKDGAAGSSWSLRSILGGRMRREGSNTSTLPASPHNEKGDPFSDGAALLHDPESGRTTPNFTPGSLYHPNYTRRQGSYASSFSYTDPFADPSTHVYGNVAANAHGHHHSRSTSDSTMDITDEDVYAIRRARPPTSLNAVLPLTDEPHALSPLLESSSRGTLAIPSSASSASHQKTSSGDMGDVGSNQSPFDHPDSSNDHDTPCTSRSSIPCGAQSPKNPTAPILPQLRSSSMIDANSSNPNTPNVKRSDTWWARFAKTPLTKRTSDISTSRQRNLSTTSAGFEFRDPNPPPRLGAIEESVHSSSSSPPRETSLDNQAPDKSRDGTGFARTASLKKFGGHGKSVSSFKTIDSETIEKMGGMDVVQRFTTRSQGTRDSSYDHSDCGSSLDHGRRASLMAGEHEYWLPPSTAGDHDHEIVASPTEVPLPEPICSPFVPNPSVKLASPSSQPLADAFPFPPVSSAAGTPNSEASSAQASQQSLPSTASSGKRPRPPSGGAVASRVQEYEKRLSVDLQSPPPGKHEEKRKTKGPTTLTTYGLVPKPNLYVANPDKKQGSGDS